MLIDRERPAAANDRPRRQRALYELLDGVTVRAPLLAVDAYRSMHELSANDPRVRLALAVGSAALFDAVAAHGASAGDARVARKVRRFLIRMSTRPTPYGLFAGVALARWDARTDLALSDEPPRRRTRPDMGWLMRFVRELETRPDVCARLRFTTDSLAVVREGRAVLHDWKPHGAAEGVERVSVRATPAVLRTLERARQATPYAELHAALLATTPGATPEKADRLLAQLAANGFLLSELRPPLLAASPALHVLASLERIPEARADAERLRCVLVAAAAFDAAPADEALQRYRTLVELAGATDENGRAAPPVQVDMALALRGDRLARAVGDEAARAAELLVRCSPIPRNPPVLAAYRQAFVARYSAAREVPLLELLDPVAGLGSPFGARYNHSNVPGHAAKLHERHKTLLYAAHTALRGLDPAFELDAATVARLALAPDAEGAPRTLDLNVFVAAESADAIDRGAFEVVVGPNLGAASAGRNLGRFADLLGADAAVSLAAAARAGEDDRRLWAELVYEPGDARLMNVAVRPAVRSHAIAHGIAPGIDPRNVIPLEELVVGVRADGFCLRWSRDGREVVPCTGHMLNYNRAPLPFRFLDLVGREGSARFSSFDWGPAEGFPYLPRVTSGRIVLRPAEWKIDRFAASHELGNRRGAPFRDALRCWRARWHVPRHVFLAAGDNRLALDLDDPDHADELGRDLAALHESRQLVLQEVVPAHDRAWMTGAGGRYVTELVVSLRLRDMPPAPPPPPLPARTRVVSTAEARGRLRPPGSEWLFVKIYGTPAGEDALIAGPLQAFARDAIADGRVDGWFFVRYADPEPHLRVRFAGFPERLSAVVYPALCELLTTLMADGTCSRFVVDTYDREVDRYGGADALAAVEPLFCADSAAVAELIREMRAGVTELDRLTIAALSIDRLLAELGLRDTERLRWYKGSAGERRDGGAEYRQRKAVLRAWLRGSAEQGAPETWLTEVLARRRDAVAATGVRLDELRRAGLLCADVATMYRSIVHMHCNRLLGPAAEAERTVIALLSRTWQGLLHERQHS